MPKLTRLFLLSSALVGATAMSGSMVFAQDDNQARTGFEIDEIVVTARKKEESLQDTLTAITAATGEDLKFKGIESGERLGQTVPNLSFSS